MRGGWIDAAGESFIKPRARVAVVCGLLVGEEGVDRKRERGGTVRRARQSAFSMRITVRVNE